MAKETEMCPAKICVGDDGKVHVRLGKCNLGERERILGRAASRPTTWTADDDDDKDADKADEKQEPSK